MLSDHPYLIVFGGIGLAAVAWVVWRVILGMLYVWLLTGRRPGHSDVRPEDR